MARFKMKKPYSKKNIGEAIVNEWVSSARENRTVDLNNIKNAIIPMIDDSGFTLELHVDSNSAPKVIHIVIPDPTNGSMTLDEWVNRKWPTPDEVEEFGRICLYGCGR